MASGGQDETLRDFGQDALEKMLYRQKRDRSNIATMKKRNATINQFGQITEAYTASQREITKTNKAISKQINANLKALIQVAQEQREAVINSARDLNATFISTINTFGREQNMNRAAQIAKLMADAAENAKQQAILNRDYYEQIFKGQHELAVISRKQTKILLKQMKDVYEELSTLIESRMTIVIDKIKELIKGIEAVQQSVTELRTMITDLGAKIDQVAKDTRDEIIRQIGTFNTRLMVVERRVSALGRGPVSP